MRGLYQPGYGCYTGTGYIDSNTKKFYRSDQPEGDIPLKLKYRIGGSAPRHNKHSDNQGRNKHRKLNDAQKRLLPPQRMRIAIMGPTGKLSFIDA